MNDQSTQTHGEADLRALLAGVDPLVGETPLASEDLLVRIRSQLRSDPTPESAALADRTAPFPSTHSAANDDAPRTNWLGRHWQGLLLTAACLVSIALAAGLLLPTFVGSIGGGDVTASSREAAGAEANPGVAAAPDAPDAPSMPDTASSLDSTQSAGEPVATALLVRSASLLVGTEDISAERDLFVSDILAMGGRVMTESTINAAAGSLGSGDTMTRTEGLANPDAAFAQPDYGVSSGYQPFPWYPSGPGVWISVEVPVSEYDRAVAAARATGEVVRLEQSSSDVTTQMADLDGRIAALESSLARLTSLMGQAASVSDVIALEAAIAQRQAELDSLRAQQSAMANQTAMSQVSLTLMSVEDANAAVSPTPPSNTWWETFVSGLAGLWVWLGRALFIVSPVLIAVGFITLARRRRRRATHK